MQEVKAPRPAITERRKHPRIGTFWRGTLITGKRVLDCRVIDVSPEGAQVYVVTPLIGPAVRVGQSVMLMVSGVGRIVGKVAWIRKSSIGLQITNPQIVADWRAEISKHNRVKLGRVVGTKIPHASA